MKRLLLTPSRDGELSVWEMPTPDMVCIVGCDPSLGRRQGTGDHSVVIAAARQPGRVVRQVAELRCRWPAARVGEAIACLAYAYSYRTTKKTFAEEQITRIPALVHIERNLADALLATMEHQEFPKERLYIPKDGVEINQGIDSSYFVQKTARTSRLLMDTMEDYMDRKAFIVRSHDTSADAGAESLETFLRHHPFGPTDAEDEPPCPQGKDEVFWRESMGLPPKGKKKPALPVLAAWKTGDYTYDVSG
jgi:hypothetical protein